MIPLLLRFWRPLAGVAAVLLVWAWHTHGLSVARREGYQQATSEDARGAEAQRIKTAEQEKADAKRVADAYRERDEIEAQFVALRTRAVPHLVCSRAPSHPSVMPQATGLPGAQASSGGLLPQPDAGDSGGTFDPGPAAIELAFEAARIVADCRMLNQSVNGVPTAP